jgi:dihydrofolate reductase
MPCPEIVLIAALAAGNRVIGRNGKLPWSLPADLQRFRQLTWGQAVILGRRTWEEDLGQRPLKNRRNIIVSSTLPISIPGKDDQAESELIVVRSIPEALEQCRNFQKAFLIGGASIYAQTLTLADTWELTLVTGEYEGDTLFPPYHSLIGTEYELVQQVPCLGYRYETYRRRSAGTLARRSLATDRWPSPSVE